MEFVVERERIACMLDGLLAAEITFPEIEPGIFCIDHTMVGPELQGQGLAGKLVEQAVNVIHEQGGKVKATCSYAAHWLEKHPEYAD